MGIISPTLRRLAEGRTEITTNMIAEAERVDAKARGEACGLSDYYKGNVDNLMALYAAQGTAQAQYSSLYQLGMAQDKDIAHYYQQYNTISPWPSLCGR